MSTPLYSCGRLQYDRKQEWEIFHSLEIEITKSQKKKSEKKYIYICSYM